MLDNDDGDEYGISAWRILSMRLFLIGVSSFLGEAGIA
jgi:hypothetical protein